MYVCICHIGAVRRFPTSNYRTVAMPIESNNVRYLNVRQSGQFSAIH